MWRGEMPKTESDLKQMNLIVLKNTVTIFKGKIGRKDRGIDGQKRIWLTHEYNIWLYILSVGQGGVISGEIRQHLNGLWYKNVHLNDIYKRKKVKALHNNSFNYDTLCLHMYQAIRVENYIKKWLYYSAWWKFKVQNYILWFQYAKVEDGKIKMLFTRNSIFNLVHTKGTTCARSMDLI